MTSHLSIMCLLAVLAPNNGKVANVTITPQHIAPGGSFEIHLTASDSDGLMGGFVLNLKNDQANFEKNIEYLWSDMNGDREGDIKMIVGPGENSRFSDAKVTDQWPAGSTTRLRVIVRDANDQNTSVDIGNVEIDASAPSTPAAPTPEPIVLKPGEGWRADFDNGTLNGSMPPNYVARGSKRGKKPMTFHIKDGIATLGAQFDKSSTEGAGDYVPLEWRAMDVSLTDYPFIELRFKPSSKKASVLVQTVLEFADGSRQTPYYYAKNPGDGKWVTQANRLAGDASLPTRWTPRKLVGLSIWVMSGEPVSVDFDWLRLRKPIDAESVREKEWVALMKQHKLQGAGEPKVLREFFPFGMFAAPPDSSSKHMVFHRQSFSNMTHHHLNFMMAAFGQPRQGKSTVEPGGDGEQSIPVIAAARDNGIRLNLRMRKATYMFSKQGAQAIEDWGRPIVKAIGDAPEVVGYDMGDERPLTELYDIVAGIAKFKQLDPSRPSMLTFWDPASVRAYGPYVPLNVTDVYPLDSTGKNAAYMYDWCKKVARDSNNQRQWIILQSFGAAPWKPHTGYQAPTPEQLRLMTWASLAGGARGLIYFSFSFDRFKMVADQWGNPNELLLELSDLGETIIPIGHRLLDATVDFDSPITVDNDKLIVGVLHASQRDVRYVIVANKDVKNKQAGKLTNAPATMLDLHSMKTVANGAIEPLAPGGGRVYLIGTTDQFETERAALQQLRHAETERTKIPDRSLARMYGDQLADALKIKAQLDALGQLMGTIEPAMYDDNPDKKVVELMSDYRERYWSVHRPWALAYDSLLSGKLPDPQQVAALTAQAKKIVPDVHKALGDHPMYPPAPEG